MKVSIQRGVIVLYPETQEDWDVAQRVVGERSRWGWGDHEGGQGTALLIGTEVRD